jgi:ADP-heptose:LPS heptosyltransferase
MNILVRFPDDLTERLLAFPFLQALHHHFKDHENFKLHILTAKKNIDVLYLLPFNAFLHELAEEDIKSMFSMHRIAHLIKLDETPDHFFCLMPEMKDTSIGLSLQIKNRFGFEDGKGKWMMNKTIRRPVNRHKSEEYLELLSLLTGKSYDRMGAIEARNIEASDPEREKFPYFILDLKLGEEDQISEEWAEFLNMLENKKVLLMMSGIGQDIARIKLEFFKKKLNGKNKVETYYLSDLIDFAKIVKGAYAFIGPNSPMIHISSYLGIRTFALFQDDQARNTSPIFSMGQVILMEPDPKTKKLPMSAIIDRLVSELI